MDLREEIRQALWNAEADGKEPAGPEADAALIVFKKWLEDHGYGLAYAELADELAAMRGKG